MLFINNMKSVSTSQVLGIIFLLFLFVHHCHGWARYKFIVEEVPYMRLCSTKNILTVNGQFPGQPIYVHRGETIIVDVYNKGDYNITLHWHGVKQPKYPWTDGPEYITQCPIQPGAKFSQKVIFSREEGTLWWHAHSQWSRATVHGPIIIYPKIGSVYPFPKPAEEVPIVLGEWWKQDIMKIYEGFVASGGDPNVSDANTINGQPGDLYPCSKPGTFKLEVKQGLTYLLRIIHAGMQDMFFFSIAGHNLTVVASDASYVKPFSSTYLTISPGQTIDVLLKANQSPNNTYYMAARVYTGLTAVPFDNTTTTAIVEYGWSHNQSPLLPHLPYYNDTSASVNFAKKFRSLASKDHPIDVPSKIDNRMFFTFSVNSFPCPNNSCAGPNGTRLSSSVNNVSFVNPTVDILEAYYYHTNGVFGARFPNLPPLFFNFTAEYLPLYWEIPKRGTEVKVLDYNSTVEIVFQGTNLVAGSDHPIHLHGYSFYVVGIGLGNFDKDKDPSSFNLVDPPLHNTIAIPVNGWTVIRFKADNPGVWFMHCHFDRHMVWGMDMAFIVKNGPTPGAKMLPPPPDMPPC